MLERSGDYPKGGLKSHKNRGGVLLTILICVCGLSLIACNDPEMKKARPLSVQPASKVADDLINDDFSSQNSAWKAYVGNWQFKQGELQQSSIDNDFPCVLREDKRFKNLDISVDFKPVSGRIDASGGIIFRAEDEDNYYIVRANALENNYRLYTFVDGLRHELASAKVTPPTINAWHQMRVVAKGDHIQAYLDGQLQLDYHDKTFTEGYTGLWTKADSVTAFDNFTVKPIE